MAGGLVRIGDILGPGGLVIGNASSSVTVNGRPVALFPCLYTLHLGCSPVKPLHCVGPVLDIPGGLTIEGSFPYTKGAFGLCGHGIMIASEDVLSLGGGGFLGAIIGFALGALTNGGFFAIDAGSAAGQAAQAFADAVAPLTAVVDAVQDAIGLLGEAVGEVAGELVEQAVERGITSLDSLIR